MIKVTIYQNEDCAFTGFDVYDHAGYADSGSDIVCAGVSTLVIATINGIEMLTNESFVNDARETDASIQLRMQEIGHDSQLLIQNMVLGLQEIESNYREYIDIIFEEV